MQYETAVFISQNPCQIDSRRMILRLSSVVCRYGSVKKGVARLSDSQCPSATPVRRFRGPLVSSFLTVIPPSRSFCLDDAMCCSGVYSVPVLEHAKRKGHLLDGKRYIL